MNLNVKAALLALVVLASCLGFGWGMGALISYNMRLGAGTLATLLFGALFFSFRRAFREWGNA